jgi:hypothetical protein
MTGNDPDEESAFEDLVGAMLRVDPAGLAGKHRTMIVLKRVSPPGGAAFLTSAGTWSDSLAPREFSSAEEARTAVVPAGTRGEPVELAYIPRDR